MFAVLFQSNRQAEFGSCTNTLRVLGGCLVSLISKSTANTLIAAAAAGRDETERKDVLKVRVRVGVVSTNRMAGLGSSCTELMVIAEFVPKITFDNCFCLLPF